MFAKIFQKLTVASVLTALAVVSFVPATTSAAFGGFEGDFSITLYKSQPVLEFEQANDSTAVYPKITLPHYSGTGQVDFEEVLCKNAYTVKDCGTVRSHKNIYHLFGSSFWPRNTKQEIYAAAREIGVSEGKVYLTAKLRNPNGQVVFANRLGFDLKKANAEPVVPTLPAAKLKNAGVTNDTAKVEWNYLTNNGQFGSYKVDYKKGWTNFVKGYGLKTDYTQQNNYTAKGLQQGTWYSFQVVPVKFKNGKYEEVGPRSNVIKVKTGKDVVPDMPAINPIGLSIVSWNDENRPKISWTKYNKYHSGYAVFLKSGHRTKQSTLNATPFYKGKWQTTHQMTKILPNAQYTVVVAPYKWENGKKTAIKNAASNKLWFTTGDAKKVESEKDLCGNSAGNDGTYSACVNDVIQHYASELRVEVTYKSATWVKAQLSGPANYAVWLKKGQTKQINAGDYFVRLTYNGADASNPKGVMIKVESSKKNVFPTPIDPIEELATPSISYPQANKVLTNYPRKAFLSWSAISGAKKYEIEIACDVCVSSSVKWLNPKKYTSTKNYYTTPALAGDNEFRFRVRAIDSHGVSSHWSDYRYFRYKTAPTPNPSQNVVLKATTASKSVNLDWNDISGLGSTFDKYNIKFKKGWHSNLNGTAVANSYVSYGSYYNLSGLQGGSWWTFQVVPTKNKVEVAAKSNIVRVWVSN